MNKTAKLFEKLDKEIQNHCNAIHCPPRNLEKADEKQGLVSILTNYFCIGYYCGIIPFKPVFNHDQQAWQLKTVKIQQVACLLIWVIFLYTFTTHGLINFYESFNSKRALTAKSYFKLLSELNAFATTFVFLKIIFTKRQNIEDSLNNQPVILQYSVQKFAKRFQISLWCFYTAVGFFTIAPIPFTTSFYGDPLKTPREAFRNYVVLGRRRYFLDKSYTRLSPGNVCLGLLEIVGRFCWSQGMCGLSALFAAPLPVVMWLAVKEFETCIANWNTTGNNKNSRITLWEIKEKYEATKRFSASVNNVWSTGTLLWLLNSTLRAMMILNQLVSSRNVASILGAVTWTSSVAFAFIISGETFKKMERFRASLLEERNFDYMHSQDKLIFKRILKELDSGPVGLGSTGLYKLDYSFTAQLLIAAVTIFLVSFEKEEMT